MAFSKENQPKNRRGGQNLVTRVNAAIKALGMTDAEFFKQVIERGLDGDQTCLRTLLAIKMPAPKSTYEPIDINMPEGLTELEQCRHINQMVFNGVISSDIGDSHVKRIMDTCKVEEQTELAEQVRLLTEKAGL